MPTSARPPVRAFAGLGSNVGDRLRSLRGAVEALRRTPEVEVVACSPVFETDPVGPRQPDFLNAAVAIDTTLSARRLLEVFQDVERRLGRTATVRWGPREIDIDLLVYGTEEIDEPGLRVPHPRLAERAFVLVPLTSIAPDLEVPRVGPVSSVLAHLTTDGVRPTDLLL